MNLNLIARSGAKVLSLCGFVLAAGLVTFHARADEWDKKTTITIDQPTQVRETFLPAGTYVFKLADSSSNRHIVQIFDEDQTHIISTILAIPNYRLQPTGNSRFAFWETPPGSARALRAWFYPGDNFGQEFPYPKQLRELAVLRSPEPAPAPAPAVTAPPEPAPTPVEPTPTPELAPRTHEQEPSQPIAENSPPPAPPAQAEAPPPAPELPKTATPYPAFGLVGLISLGLFAIIRAARLE
jgi:hypothetical protein